MSALEFHNLADYDLLENSSSFLEEVNQGLEREFILNRNGLRKIW